MVRSVDISFFSTLFLPFDRKLLPKPSPASRVLLLNAFVSHDLALFDKTGLLAIQYFRPCAQALTRAGYEVAANVRELESFDFVLVAMPQNRIEGRALLAEGLSALKPDGILVAAAPNDQGGGSLRKTMQELGARDIGEMSKNKARVVWGGKPAGGAEILEKAMAAGAMQQQTGSDFWTMPGIFGWDKEDRGSKLLAQHLPPGIAGAGADFGCGYGYLAHHALSACAGIENLHCIDADWRALEACRANLQGFPRTEFLWEDLTQDSDLFSGKLDFIVMNPPFHEGKTGDPGIGMAFIRRASASLKRGGMLYMVANAHLPYEREMRPLFSSVQNIHEGGGFKVVFARK